jgi:hypothetical protein
LLGALVSELAEKNNKQVFVSTHDSEFLRGALSRTQDIKVFNVRQLEGEHFVQDVDLSDFRTLTHDQPEILNERILNSFFYRKTLITESETDRVFYEYVAALYHWDLFQNKNFVGLSGIDRVLGLFKKMSELNLNVGAIVDIDFLVTRKYPAHLMDNDIKLLHNKVKQKFWQDKYDQTKLKKKGTAYIRSIDPDFATMFEDLIDLYAIRQLYIPKVGELESWSGSSKNNLDTMLKYVQTAKRRSLSVFMKSVLE